MRTYQEKVRQREAELAARAAVASPDAAPDAKRLRWDGAFLGNANGAPHAQAPPAAAAPKAEPCAQVKASSARRFLCWCISMYLMRCIASYRAMGSWCGFWQVCQLRIKLQGCRVSTGTGDLKLQPCAAGIRCAGCTCKIKCNFSK